jgi:hypothetical protein
MQKKQQVNLLLLLILLKKSIELSTKKGENSQKTVDNVYKLYEKCSKLWIILITMLGQVVS